jgi:hypothetical protein
MMFANSERNKIAGFILIALAIFIALGWSVYALSANHTDERMIAVTAEIRVVRADIAREVERMNRSEASMAEVRDRLSRIETKVDAILVRTEVLERNK